MTCDFAAIIPELCSLRVWRASVCKKRCNDLDSDRPVGSERCNLNDQIYSINIQLVFNYMDL